MTCNQQVQEAVDRLADGAIDVTLRSTSLSPSDVQQLSHCMRQHSGQIHIVSLLFCQLPTTPTSSHFHVLCQALAECRHLVKLDLFNTLLPDECVLGLIHSISSTNTKTTTLEELNLHSNSMSDATCAVLCKQLGATWPALRRLVVSNNELSDAGVLGLLSCVRACAQLVDVQFAANNGVSQHTQHQVRDALHANALAALAKQREELSRVKRRNAELERKCNALLTQQAEQQQSSSTHKKQPQEEEEVGGGGGGDWADLSAIQEREFDNFISNREAEIAQAQQRRATLKQQASSSSSPARLRAVNLTPLPTSSSSSYTYTTSGGNGVVASSSPSRLLAADTEPSPTRMPALTPGQWKCPECLYNNAETRQTCLSCQYSRPAPPLSTTTTPRQSSSPSRQTTTTPPTSTAWTCASCTFVNTKQSYLCEMCAAARRSL